MIIALEARHSERTGFENVYRRSSTHLATDTRVRQETLPVTERNLPMKGTTETRRLVNKG